MANLKAAGKKFDQAIARLETALNKWADEANQDSAGRIEERERLDAELGSLRDDHARVSRQLKELRARHDALRRVTDTLSGQLDETVGELAELLEA
jgi:predicted  nucleic acid-binding Zn-ribbon protein